MFIFKSQMLVCDLFLKTKIVNKLSLQFLQNYVTPFYHLELFLMHAVLMCLLLIFFPRQSVSFTSPQNSICLHENCRNGHKNCRKEFSKINQLWTMKCVRHANCAACWHSCKVQIFASYHLQSLIARKGDLSFYVLYSHGSMFMKC